MSDQLDPELAALLGGDDTGTQKAADASRTSSGDTPDFNTLFGGIEAPMEEQELPSDLQVDLTRKCIEMPTKFEAETAADYFSDSEYYKKALTGEGEEAQKVHDLLSKYLRTRDPKDRGVYRQQLIPTYWYLAATMALHSASQSAPLPKRLAVRFGALLPSLLSPELRDVIQRVIFPKEIEEPIYYVDEWMAAVATGQIKASATDEVKVSRGDDRSRYNAAMQKAQGRRDAASSAIKARTQERTELEAFLRAKAEELSQHRSDEVSLSLPSPYTDLQKKAATEIMDILRRLLSADKALVLGIEEYKRANDEFDSASQKAKGVEGAAKTDLQAVAQEFETIKQMSKLCIGRQGNHFPLLSTEYYHAGIRDMGTRENVTKILAWLESIDSEAYCRPYKNSLNRIVPFILLLPCYGDYGICWEPFDRYNRASSRGRIAIPLYPKNLQAAIITAIADLRWQVAKEKASYYWMEEGLTGNYYQWFTAKKIKGDVKEYFIQDYTVWITKESEGIQKLDKEVRAIFWRYLPFTQTIKDKLKTRSYVYQELYQKDVNRSLSDGY